MKRQTCASASARDLKGRTPTAAECVVMDALGKLPCIACLQSVCNKSRGGLNLTHICCSFPFTIDLLLNRHGFISKSFIYFWIATNVRFSLIADIDLGISQLCAKNGH